MKNIILNMIFIFVLPYLMCGIIKKVKAFFARRKGPSVWQYGYDLAKLLRKEELLSNLSCLRNGGVLTLAGVLAAAMLIPQISGRSILALDYYDYILFIYMLSFSRFFTVIAAMESGCSFEGMGSSRELIFSVTGEIALMMTVAALAFYGHAENFSGIFEAVAAGGTEGLLIAILASCVLFVLMLLEGSRMPIDDPETHLELTMIHEAMVLDQSGPQLAFMSFSGMVKVYLFASFILSLVLAQLRDCAWYGIYFAIGIAVISIIIGIIESLQARLRMVHVHQYILFSAALSLILLLSVIIFKV
ncbi:MAG: NADH-quinone oxidoreductase subunit H [Lentisphaeria bacterium]|nr:NADH-quinone oxidoreductase subunit H [Lentisphaeria bacterium]